MRFLFITIIFLLSISFSQAEAQLKKTIWKTSPPELSAVDLYRAEVTSKIEKNWQLDFAKIDNVNVIASISLKVAPDGRVIDFNFDKQSWNKHLDASVINAVMTSIPFKPFPDEITEAFLTIHIRFTPAGMR